MDAEIKKEWVNRLRSGKPQLKGALKRVDQYGKAKGYCCLGVLCEMAEEVGIVESVTMNNGRVDFFSSDYPYDRESNYLPRAVQQWAGLDSSSPVVPSGAIDDDGDVVDAIELAFLNDSDVSFKVIAHHIEKDDNL